MGWQPSFRTSTRRHKSIEQKTEGTDTHSHKYEVMIGLHKAGWTATSTHHCVPVSSSGKQGLVGAVFSAHTRLPLLSALALAQRLGFASMFNPGGRDEAL
jgi:hypothetical protein